MTKPPSDRLALSVALFGVGVSLASYSLGGAFAGLSTAVGSALALVNLVVLRSIVLRVVAGDIHTKTPLLALIFIKMGVLMFLVYLFISKQWVEPIAFTIGLSSLVVGLISGSLFLSPSRARARASQRSES